MSFIDWCIDAFYNITEFFGAVVDWLSDKFDGVSGFGDNLLGDANGAAVGLTFVFTGFLAYSLLGDPFHTGMDTLPLIPRILTPIIFIPICYFICAKILD